MEILAEFLKRNSDSSRPMFIHVIGDAILDEDYEVTSYRISPECPNINVLLSEESKPARRYPGGAANVCSQLKNFNTRPRLFSLIDAETRTLFVESGIKWWGDLPLSGPHFNPRKRRFYENGVQVGCRWDIEKECYGLDDKLREFQAELFQKWLAFQAEPDVIVFSDYDKGLFYNTGIYPHIVEDIPTIVDPKNKPIERWQNCTIFKPNAKEALELSGLKDWRMQCDFFMEKLNCKAVVITQAGVGVVGKIKDYFEYTPKNRVDPFQVIGAGDCFIAMLALAIAHEFEIEEAVEIAFKISSIYVQQPFRTMMAPAHLGVKTVNPEFLRNRDFKLVFTNGCFDLIHTGHIETLKFAKSKGDRLVVGLNSDKSIKSLKGANRPIFSLEERVKILSSLEFVDFVVSFDEEEPERLIEQIRPDILVKGGDWKNRTLSGANYVDEVLFAPFVRGKSTSSIIERINEEKDTAANQKTS